MGRELAGGQPAGLSARVANHLRHGRPARAGLGTTSKPEAAGVRVRMPSSSGWATGDVLQAPEQSREELLSARVAACGEVGDDLHGERNLPGVSSVRHHASSSSGPESAVSSRQTTA